MGALTKASGGLLIGALGQALAYADLFPHFPFGIIWMVSFIPWLIVFGISFCNRPPFGPRPFRWCLIVAMIWYALASIIVEVLRFFIHVPPRGVDPIVAERVIIGARVIMFLGMLSFIVLIRTCITLRRYETKKDA